MLGKSWAVTTVTSPVFTKASYQLYEKAEATFTIAFNGGNYSNPYDPAIALVDAVITLPNATNITLPCFYFIPASYSMTSATWWDATENAAAAKWMLRYAPTMVGTHTIKIKVVDANGTINSITTTITVTAGTKKGFIRLNPAQNQFCKFDDGTPYYPVGTNLTWNDGTLIKYYNTYLSSMGANKYSWMRYWLTDFARQALEWSSGHWSGWYGGIGQYSQRGAGVLDSVVNESERQGVYIQLVLQHHGQVSTTANAEWSGNPYNAANGGPVPSGSAGQFFTNATAIAKTKNQYRYVVARWGYSTTIMAWELFNEVEFSDGIDTDIDSWHDQMSIYLKSIDVNNHIVTTSAGGDNSTLPLFDNNASMDLLQYHIYAGAPIEKATYDQSRTLQPILNKPLWCGEFGLNGSYPAAAAGDNWGDHVRKTMWVGMFSEVPTMFWYGDNTYIQGYNLFNIFKPLSTYLNGIDIVANTGGNFNAFKFGSNPTITGSLMVSPGNTNFGGVNSPDPWTTTIDNQGNVPGTANLNSFLQGVWHGGTNRDARFTATFQSTGSVDVNFGSASASQPVTIQVYQDGVLKTTWTVPAGGGTFTLGSIPAGTHTIRFYNNGNDWASVNNYSFNNISLSQLLAYGYHGTSYAYGYVYDHSLPEWIDPASVTAVTSASIKVGSLAPGSYKVDFFDPQAGTAFFAGGTYTALASPNDSITVPLPSFKKDLAFKVYPSALPVEFVSFSGQMSDDQAKLQWSTASEKNNDHFDVQRSADGISYEAIGTVKGSGHSSSVLDYTFTDEHTLMGSAYYRIRQVDSDGNSALSNVIILSRYSDALSLFPNPAGSDLNLLISSGEAGKAEVSVFNMMGSEVLHQTIDLIQGQKLMNINLGSLPASVYFLKLSRNGAKPEIHKFIRQ
ncbi:MAG: T9SS type A sorting domain-containing protein [Cytophagaceae bacterium]